ncbi:MAG: M16 family metallopeptidase [Candidatus Aminicenantaceae bacterium]
MHSKTQIMGKIIALLVFFSILGFSFAEQQDKSKYFELDNGLKVFLLERHNLPLLNITAAVNLGSKNETEETSGLVHILEHYILFGGTESQSGSEIGREIRRHGAYFNAHTGRDLITFDISLLSEYADFALRNQKEILFNLKLSKEVLDAEKKIILEELAQIKDDPFKYASSLVFQNLFSNHPYKYPIYGKKEIIEAATVNQLENFYKEHFVPSNCGLALVGDFQVEEMEKTVKEIFGDLKKEEFPSSKFEKIGQLKKTIEIKEEMDINQAYLVIGMPGPDYNHSDQYIVDVIVQILGRGVNPMLGYALRGRRDLAHSISMSYVAHKYGGAILIYLIVDPKNMKTAKNETIKFLKKSTSMRYSEEDYLSIDQAYIFDYLECAKNSIKFDSYRGKERGLDVANSLARFLLLNENSTEGSYLENIDKISSSDLRKAAARYLSRGKYIVVSIIPKKNK